jgi:hypothetical protein
MLAGRHAAVQEESILVAMFVVVALTSRALCPILLDGLEGGRCFIGNLTLGSATRPVDRPVTCLTDSLSISQIKNSVFRAVR